MDTKKVIITIGRQFGSGGRLVGHRLAERLGIAYYDKELIKIDFTGCHSILKDFNQKALSIKSHLSYQLGQALIKAYKNKWGALSNFFLRPTA